MKIKSIASSSAGNCHIIESCGEQIIIDCGINFKQIQKALDYDFNQVVACLISHEHMDHCKSARNIESAGIQIYTTPGTIFDNDLVDAIVIQPQKTTILSDIFAVFPFPLSHFDTNGSAVDCLGFLVYSYPEKKTLAYITDTGKLPAKIPNLNYLMIEANHSLDALAQSGLDQGAIFRISKSHLNIDQVCEFVGNHQLDEIHLIHLSDGHSDESGFKRVVQAVAGCPVYVAEK